MLAKTLKSRYLRREANIAYFTAILLPTIQLTKSVAIKRATVAIF